HLHLPEPPPTARAVVERHATHVVEGDLAAAEQDFYGNAFVVFEGSGGSLPADATTFEVIGERHDLTWSEFTIRYETAGGPVDITTKWHLLVGAWRLTDAARV
ncbi:MAG: hypothetical protein AAGC53_20295, partial [Actinomycetota bacterium]